MVEGAGFFEWRGYSLVVWSSSSLIAVAAVENEIRVGVKSDDGSFFGFLWGVFVGSFVVVEWSLGFARAVFDPLLGSLYIARGSQ